MLRDQSINQRNMLAATVFSSFFVLIASLIFLQFDLQTPTTIITIANNYSNLTLPAKTDLRDDNLITPSTPRPQENITQTNTSAAPPSNTSPKPLIKNKIRNIIPTKSTYTFTALKPINTIIPPDITVTPSLPSNDFDISNVYIEFPTQPQNLSRHQQRNWSKNNTKPTIIFNEKFPNGLYGQDIIAVISVIISPEGKLVPYNNDNFHNGIREEFSNNSEALNILKHRTATAEFIPALIDGNSVYCLLTVVWEANPLGLSKYKGGCNVEYKH